MSKLVIVESPTKAKKLKGWLGKEYVVESSVGHIRDLPSGKKEVPEDLQKTKGLRHGIIITDDGFEPIYVPTKGRAKKVLADLKKRLKDADELYLATDPDREGEAISWHLVEALKPKVPVKRVTFNEITKKAVQEALDHPREIDQRLVNAQETRRILDRLLGYELSPLVSQKVVSSRFAGLSAGRVQSVALKLIVDRERERMGFETTEYAVIEAKLAKDSMAFEASLIERGGKRVVDSNRFFDDLTGALKDPDDVVLLDLETAQELGARYAKAEWTIEDIQAQRKTRQAPIPFITDTLLRSAGGIGLGARDAMRTAQELYENGFITYHRTDSPALSEEGLKGARDAVLERFGADYLLPEPRNFESKNANAQEAHEAIRPAGERFVHPDQSGLKGRALSLYRLIYNRTLACQMKPEEYTQTSVTLTVEDARFRASGKKVEFPGWRKAYGYGDEQDTLLPALAQGDHPDCQGCEANGKSSSPRSRFTEGSLIERLKDEGIGRPSTYSETIEKLQNRDYVFNKGNSLAPSFLGIAVVQLLEEHFPTIVDTGFTADMERSLDQIAAGNQEWQPYLTLFWHGPSGLEEQVKQHRDQIDPRVVSTIPLPALEGTGASLRVSRFGPYIEVIDEESGEPATVNVPADIAPADLDPETIERLAKQASQGPESLGDDPETGKPVFLLDGRYGPYVQLGEVTEEEKKPPRASIPKGWDPTATKLDDALFLLSLPKEICPHPEGGRVLVGLGRFGPYVCREHEGDRDFRSLKDMDHLRGLRPEEALEILSKPKGGRGRRAATVLNDLGEHDGEKLQVLDGKYGPYVKYQKVNATVPEGKDPKSLTKEEALELVAERAKKKGTKRSAKKTTRKKAAKKTAKK